MWRWSCTIKKIIRPFKNMLVSLDHKTCFWFFFLPAIMVLSSFAVTIWQRKSWILLDKIDSLFQLEWIFFLGTLKINANALSLIFFINANTLIIMYHVSDNFGKNRKTFFVLPVKDFYVIVFDNLHWLFWKSIIYPISEGLIWFMSIIFLQKLVFGELIMLYTICI